MSERARTLKDCFHRWQRVSITPLEYEQLKLLYQELKITPAKEMEVAA